ncbi:MAG: glycosyltransferase family 87 protein [Lapillicoccus sp.]
MQATPNETLLSRLGWYAGWLVVAPFAVFGAWYATQVGLGYDSHAYWAAVQDMDHLYDASALSRDAYLYSPLFAQAIWPLGRLPSPVFGVVWSLVQAGLFVWLLRPLRARWFVPAIVATLPEILTGNIYALMASALVLGATRGSPWIFVALTKITPGLVGVAWLTAGRRWRALAGGAVVGALLVGVSYLAAPTTWQDWVHFLASGTDGSAGQSGLPWLTLTLLGVGLAVTVFASLTRRAWLLPVATILVSPTFGPNTLTLLSAVPRLMLRQREESPGATRRT